MKELTDLMSPRQVERRLLEKDVQKQCVDWARARGYWARKLSSEVNRSLPDYIFSKGRQFFTEFKKPGDAPTANQVDEMDAMRAAGWTGFVCDNFEAFKAWVLEFERA
jgi:hypothetical protein